MIRRFTLYVAAAAVMAAALGVGAQAQRGAAPAAPQAPRPPAPAAPRPPAPRAPAQRQSAYTGPRTPDGKPDLNGIWQVLGTAHWNLEAHSASEGVPAGLSVVEGGPIPYKPEALKQRDANFKNRMNDDPLRKCYMPGVPRATYLPFPFEITQMPKNVLMTFEFAHAARTIFIDGPPHIEDVDFYMGDARGHWDGDTLVIDTVSLGDQTWFDQAGNFHSDALKVTERFTPTDATHIDYSATIDDPKTFTRPWTMRMTIYKRVEKNLELLDYECVEHIYEKAFQEKTAKR